MLDSPRYERLNRGLYPGVEPRERHELLSLKRAPPESSSERPRALQKVAHVPVASNSNVHNSRPTAYTAVDHVQDGGKIVYLPYEGDGNGSVFSQSAHLSSSRDAFGGGEHSRSRLLSDLSSSRNPSTVVYYDRVPRTGGEIRNRLVADPTAQTASRPQPPPENWPISDLHGSHSNYPGKQVYMSEGVVHHTDVTPRNRVPVQGIGQQMQNFPQTNAERPRYKLLPLEQPVTLSGRSALQERSHQYEQHPAADDLDNRRPYPGLNTTFAMGQSGPSGLHAADTHYHQRVPIGADPAQSRR